MEGGDLTNGHKNRFVIAMPRNYVYWRRHDGRPHEQPDEKFAPWALLSVLGETAKLQPGGGISWPFYNSHEYKLAIQSSVVIANPNGGEICAADAAGLVWRAIKEAIRTSGGGKPIRPAEFLRSLNLFAADYFRRPIVSCF